MKKVVQSWCSALLSTCRRKRRSLNTTVRGQQTLKLLQPREWHWLLHSHQLWHCHCNHRSRESTCAPAQKQKKCTWKSPSQNALARTVKDKEREDDGAKPSQGSEPLARPSQEPEEEMEETWVDPYPWVSSGKQQKDFSSHLWVYYCLASLLMGQWSQQCGMRG